MRVISVVGPTASGKTELAIKIAEKCLHSGIGVDYVSLDARQIYKRLPILSGADVENLPRDENFQTYNLLDKEIDEEFSLGLLVNTTQEVLARAEAAGRQVLLVGGTFLYHQRVLEDNDLTQVPPDDNVRFAAENMSVTEIQDWLKKVNETMFFNLNESDRKNPRRLVRKLEIAIFQQIHEGEEKEISATRWQHVYVQPDYKISDLESKITARVKKRYEKGAIEEVKSVIRRNAEVLSNKAWLSKMPLGFAEIARMLAGEINEEECQKLWSLHEWQYVKRQLTFLKKLLADNQTNLVDEREFLTD